MLATDLKQLRRVTACGLLACALVVPTASAKTADERLSGNFDGARTSSLAGSAGGPRQDLRSPDSRDAAAVTSSVTATAAAVPQDLRSPDARDAAARTSSLAGTVAAPRQDLRSPDARDVGQRYAPVAISQEPSGTPDVATPGGFDWGTAGLTAAILIGMFAVMYGMLVAVRQGRRHIPGS